MKICFFETACNGKTNLEAYPFQPDAQEVENQVVNLYPQVTYQTFEGFGGAITDAAGYVYSLMNEEQKRQVVEQCH